MLPVVNDSLSVHEPSGMSIKLMARAISIAMKSTAALWSEIQSANTNGADVKSLTKQPIQYLVSVGSGDARVERVVEELYGITAITVDPEPQYNAHFPNIDVLMAYIPEVIGNCVVLLLWPERDRTQYDYECIQMLQPVNFLILYEKNVYETNGAAGSFRMHKWLSTQDTYRKLDQRVIRRERANIEIYHYLEELMQAEGFKRAPEDVNFEHIHFEWYVRRGTAVVAEREWRDL